MWIMTGFAALDSDRWMLERKWASLVYMAFQTGFFVREPLADKRRSVSHSPSRCKSAMGIMAIGALHKSFIHSVFER
jgi:hypothetical protein